MESKHTSGPWRVKSEGNKLGVFSDSCIDHIATVHGGWNALHKDANARLIAAAPDMLECLKWALEQMGDDIDPDHQDAMAHARSVVARATGQE